MRENVELHVSVFTGDMGDCIPYPEVPVGSVRPEYYESGEARIVKGHELSDNPRLRYFGPVNGWYVIPEGTVVYRQPKETPYTLDTYYKTAHKIVIPKHSNPLAEEAWM